MSRRGAPIVERILKRLEKLKTDSASQRLLDQEMVESYTQSHVVTVQDTRGQDVQGKDTPRKVTAGQVGTMVDRDVNVLRGRPMAVVMVRGGTDAERHASDTLEPWLNTAIWRAARDFLVWDRGLLDLNLVGEFWSKVLPAPQFWAGYELEKLVAKKRQLAEAGEDTKEINEEIRIYKRDKFPIVWQYVDALSVYPDWDEEGIAEVYEERKLSRDRIESRFGPIEDIGSQDDEIQVVEYANETHVATVLKDGKRFLKDPWEHGLGVNPYVRIVRNPMRSSGNGHYRRGSAYHARGLLQAQDETLTSWHAVMQREVETPPLFVLVPQLRARLGLSEKEIKVKPGDPVVLYAGPEGTELASRYPTATVNPQLGQLFALLTEFADRAGGWRPQLIGAGGEAGESAVRLDMQRQGALSELEVAHQELERGFAAVGERMFRAVLSLNRDYPEAMDNVTVRMADKAHGSREIEVSPKDVQTYEWMIGGKITLNLTVHHGQAVTNARLLTDPQHPLLDDNTARQTELGFENPQDIGDRIYEQEIIGDGVAVLRKRLQERAMLVGEQLQEADMRKLLQNIAQMPPAAQQVLMGEFGDMQSSPLMENLKRGQSNVQRTGRLQRESMLQGVSGQREPQGVTFGY